MIQSRPSPKFLTRNKTKGARSFTFLLAGSLAIAGCERHQGVAPKAATLGSSQLPSFEMVSSRSRALASAFAVAEGEAKGRLGVTVVHVESGERTSFHDDERFPMQSVFKLPLAVALLARVDAGELRLDEAITIKPQDLRSGPPNALADELPNGGTRSIQKLFEQMIIHSDNSATDLLLTRIGGAAKVTAKMRELGILGIDVSRSEAELNFDVSGVASPPPRETWTLQKLESLYESVPADQERAAMASYLRDPRDTSTPLAMAALLLRVHQRDLLARPSANLLVDTLEKTETGTKRLKAGFPPGTVVAHKTGGSGTFEGVTAACNDVGIVTLPNNAGHVVIAAFLRESRGDSEARDSAIAAVARAVNEAYAPR
jgi:beta-lactamase class A